MADLCGFQCDQPTVKIRLVAKPNVNCIIGFLLGRWRDLWPRLRTAVVRWDWGTKDPLQETMPGQEALACWDRKKMRIVITGKYFKHA